MIYISSSSLDSKQANVIQSIEVCNSMGKIINLKFWYPSNFLKLFKKNNNINFGTIHFTFSPIYCFNSNWLKKINPIIGFYVKETSFIIIVLLKLILNRNNDVIYSRHNTSFKILNFFKKFGLIKNRIFLEIHLINDSIKKLKYIDGFIALNEEIERILLENKYKNVITAHDGVNMEIFKPIPTKLARKKLNLEQGKSYCIYTGRYQTLGKEKGIPEIIRSIKHINNNNIIFLFVGGPLDLKDKYLKIAEESNIDKNKLKFIDHVDQKKLSLYLSAADVFLMPFPKIKHYDLYMSPLKMFEYMAHLKPIITTNLKSISKILNHQNSFISNPGDIKSLAKNIEKSLTNYNDKKVNSAYEKVKSFTWDKRAEKILNFIGTV